MKYDDSLNSDNFNNVESSCAICDAVSGLLTVLSDADCIQASATLRESVIGVMSVVSNIKYTLNFSIVEPF